VPGSDDVKATTPGVKLTCEAFTRRRDETIKRHLYERSGVFEYWIVDPDLDAVRIHRKAEDRFEPALSAATRVRRVKAAAA
jgi:hypothetical protein